MTPTLAQITKELLGTYNRQPRKRLGQHFLIDPKVLQRIIDAAELNSDDLVIEIGSGLGVVTSEIAKLVYQVIAVEVDKELVQISKQVLKQLENIAFVAKDILRVDGLCKSIDGVKILDNVRFTINKNDKVKQVLIFFPP